MKKIFNLTMPFLLIGIVFIIIGIHLNDSSQVYLGIGWLAIALIAYLIRKKKKNN